jgi:predicted nucleic acid-binding protein
MQLPDVNVLIYAHRQDAPEHDHPRKKRALDVFLSVAATATPASEAGVDMLVRETEKNARRKRG